MLSVLKSLPITNKTALRESKIPDVVERWAVAAVVAARKPPPPPPPATTATTLGTVTLKAADSGPNTTTLTDNEAIAVAAPVVSIYEAASAVEDSDKAATAEPEATTSSESSPPASPPPLLPSLNTITPVSILASAKDSKDAKRKRRVTFAEMHEESTFSPEPAEDTDENDDISSSTQGAGDADRIEGIGRCVFYFKKIFLSLQHFLPNSVHLFLVCSVQPNFVTSLLRYMACYFQPVM